MHANSEAPTSDQIHDEPGKDLGQLQNNKQERMLRRICTAGQILEQPVDEKKKEDERGGDEEAPVHTPAPLIVRNERFWNGRYEVQKGHFSRISLMALLVYKRTNIYKSRYYTQFLLYGYS